MGCDSDAKLLDFCRKYTLHGTPVVFAGSEDQYYDFRKRIAESFNINFHEVFITGSAKLGFSPHKEKAFSLESDVDVAIVSARLFEEIMSNIYDYQIQLRSDRKAVSERELGEYHRFLEYAAMGWMRPDLLPTSFQIEELKKNWFSFFQSISYGKSEVGNYKVNAGVFKTYWHFEQYTLLGVKRLYNKLKVGNLDGSANKA